MHIERGGQHEAFIFNLGTELIPAGVDLDLGMGIAWIESMLAGADPNLGMCRLELCTSFVYYSKMAFIN